MPSLYPLRWGSPRRDCNQATTTHATGRIVWSQPLPGPAPTTLLLWDSHLVVETSETVLVYAGEGRLLWSRPKRAGTPIAIGNACLHLVNPGLSLEAIDIANQSRLTEVVIPALASAEFELLLLWPQASDFIATAYLAHPTYDSEARDTPIPQPLLLADRTVYGKIMPAWHTRFTGSLTLPPLYNPDRAEWLVAFAAIEIVQVGTGARIAPVPLPVEDPVEWSVDPAGTICLTGHRDGHLALTTLSPRGEILWTWIDPARDDRWATRQPPIRSASGRVYALTDRRLLAIDGGTLSWSCDVPDGTGALAHGTALADGSILVTGGRTLRQVDAQGRLLFSLAMPDDILTPPIVDAAGAIHLATAAALHRIL